MASNQFAFGSGLLYGLRNDTAIATPRRLGVLQDVEIDFEGDIKELYGQFQFPVDVARGKVKITGKAKFATISVAVYNDLYFGQGPTTTGQKLLTYNEAQTPSAGGTGTTNAATATSSAVLTFASLPASAVVGAAVTDTTAPTAIAPGTTIVSTATNTATMSAKATGPGVGSGDSISFSPVATVANAGSGGAAFVQDLGPRYASNGNLLTNVG